MRTLMEDLRGAEVLERNYRPGQMVYSEGEPGDAVYIIEEGEIEVLRDAGRTPVVLAVLRRGQIFGEMAVLRDKPRSTTTRSVGNARLVAIGKEDFLAAFKGSNPLALPLLRMLCERLLRAETKLIQNRLFSEAAPVTEIARMRLLPASKEVEAQIGSDGIEIAGLPFRLGGRPLGSDSTRSDGGVFLRAPDSAQLSPNQFVVEEQAGRLYLRDLGSHLGTLVNGRRVASFEERSVADLTFGENLIQAGGVDSPYVFHILIERREESGKPRAV